MAAEACDLYRLPARPTQADLEVGYATRGAQLVACDGRRELAVQTHQAEHDLERKWAAAREERGRAWWRRLTPGRAR